MSKRGLNKGRGLGSLIPQKIETEEKKEKSAEEQAAETVSSTKSVKSVKNNANNADNKEDKAADKKTVQEIELEEDAKTGSVTIRLSQVVPNKEQPRKAFDEEAIDELAASIKQFGVLQPLLVQKKGNYYELIAGERRWRAARKAGLTEVPVIIRDFTDQETMEISLIENIQRENLNPIEEAEAYKRLLDEFHLTQEEVAKRVSKSRTAVTNSMRLLKLCDGVREMVISSELSMGHARALLAIENPAKQLELAQLVVKKKMSVRDTEKLVKKTLKPVKTERKGSVLDDQIATAFADISRQLTEKIGTKVSVQTKDGKKGKIEIEYYSNEDLERILEMLGQEPE